MRLFRGLSTSGGDKLGTPMACARPRRRSADRCGALRVSCPAPPSLWRERKFCSCAETVLRLIHISRGQPAGRGEVAGPFLTTVCRSLMCKGNPKLPSCCPHAFPQNAGTNPHRRSGQRATGAFRWINPPEIIQKTDCAVFDRRLQVPGATGDFGSTPRLSSSFSTVGGDNRQGGIRPGEKKPSDASEGSIAWR